MKKGFDDIATGKRIDIILQCALFIIMILAVCESSLNLFGLYIMAAGQVLSSIIWVFILSGDTPKLISGNIVRAFILIVGLLLFSICLIDSKTFLLISCYMIIVGPILGISYFSITINEISFYSKVRKPYYLL